MNSQEQKKELPRWVRHFFIRLALCAAIFALALCAKKYFPDEAARVCTYLRSDSVPSLRTKAQELLLNYLK